MGFCQFFFFFWYIFRVYLFNIHGSCSVFQWKMHLNACFTYRKKQKKKWMDGWMYGWDRWIDPGNIIVQIWIFNRIFAMKKRIIHWQNFLAIMMDRVGETSIYINLSTVKNLSFWYSQTGQLIDTARSRHFIWPTTAL